MELNFNNELRTSQSISCEQKINIFSSIKMIGSHLYQKKVNNNYNKYQIVKQCLNSLDIFNNMMEQNSQQKQKIIRDVRNMMEIKIYQQNQIIYSINQLPQYFYLVLKGQVYAYIPKQVQNQNGQKIIQYKQIDRFIIQQGFGDAQFISGKTRVYTSCAKQPETVLGLLNHKLFTQIIQKYKMRIYYKKIQYFLTCPLFQNIEQTNLEIVVGHSKPKQFKLGQVIFKQGSSIKNFYYILSGQIQLYQIEKKSLKCFKNYDKISQLNIYSPKKQTLLTYKVNNYSPFKKIVYGTLGQGSFIGDMQIILSKKNQYTAKCITQKVKMYYINKNIIENMLSKENIKQLISFYQNKDFYHSKKLDNQLNLSQFINEKLNNDYARLHGNCLTQRQIQKKKLILKRYCEAIPTYVGCMGPKEIEQYVQKKKNFFEHKQKNQYLPKIKQIFEEKGKQKKSKNKNNFYKKRILTEDISNNSCQFLDNNYQKKSIFGLETLKSMLIPRFKEKKKYEKSPRSKRKAELKSERSINIKQSQNKIKQLIQAEWKQFKSHQLMIQK